MEAATETTTTVDGLHVVTVGEGPACLIPHGGPGLHHCLYRTLDPLASGRMLVYWDHRGHGRSAPLPDGPLDMALFADDAVRVADALGVDAFSVLGHSFGGWVAQELALRAPRRVSALVLVATTPGQLGDTESPDDEHGEPMPTEVADLLTRPPASSEELAEQYRQLGPHFLRGADSAAYLDSLDPLLLSADSMVRVFDALSRWSSVDRLALIVCPTLVIAGRHDVFCSPPQLHRIASRIAHSREVVFDETGHFPWLESPERFFTLVGSHLDEHQGGATSAG